MSEGIEEVVSAALRPALKTGWIPLAGEQITRPSNERVGIREQVGTVLDLNLEGRQVQIRWLSGGRPEWVRIDRIRPADAGIEWRTAVMELAERYYRQGHADEDAGIWDRAEAYRIAYADLCALVGSLDPRPGGGSSPAKPW